MTENIAIVTGGSSGLGAALSEELAGRGLRVLIVSRNAQNLVAIARRINEQLEAPLVEWLAADVSELAGVLSVFDYVKAKNYHPAYLFNNAGVGPFFDPREYREKWVNDIINTNLKGAILFSCELLKQVGEKEAAIINIISSLALKTLPNTAVYTASKWGLRGFTESLQADLRGTNIQVMGVYPGRFASNFWNPQELSEKKGEFMDASELARKILSNLLDSKTVFVKNLVLGAG